MNLKIFKRQLCRFYRQGKTLHCRQKHRNLLIASQLNKLNTHIRYHCHLTLSIINYKNNSGMTRKPILFLYIVLYIVLAYARWQIIAGKIFCYKAVERYHCSVGSAASTFVEKRLSVGSSTAGCIKLPFKKPSSSWHAHSVKI